MRKHKSFKSELIKFFIMIASIPIVFLAIVSSFYLYGYLTRSNKQENMELANRIKSEVSAYFNEPESLLRQFGHFLGKIPDRHVDPMLSDFMESNALFEDIFIVDKDGIVQRAAFSSLSSQSLQDSVGTDLSKTPIYQLAQKTNEPVWSELFLSPITGRVSISLVMPWQDSTLTATLNLAGMLKITKSLGSDKIVYIIDKNGAVVFSSDTVDSGTRENISNIISISDIKHQQAKYLSYTKNKLDYLGAAIHISDIDLIVMVAESKKTAIMPIFILGSIVLFTVVTSITIIGFAGYFLARRLHNHLNNLITMTRKVAEGDFSIQIQPQVYHDFEILANSFNDMTQAILLREQAIAQSEEALNAIFSSADNIALFTTDLNSRDTKILEFSPGAEKIFAYSRNEIVGQKVSTLHTKEQVELFDNFTNRLRNGEKGYSGEMNMIRNGGELFPTLLTIHPLKDSAGQIIGAVAAVLDISDYKIIQQDYRILFTQMFDGFALHEVILDEQGKPIDYRYKDVNPAFEKITGLKRSHVLGKRVTEVIPNIEKLWIDLFGNVAITGTPVRFCSYSPALDSYYEVIAYQTKPGQFACIFEDISNKVYTEKKNVALFKSLERKTKELESIIYVSSHDLRSPLVNIMGYSKELLFTTQDIRKIICASDISKDHKQQILQYLDIDIAEEISFISTSAVRLDVLQKGLLKVCRMGRDSMEIDDVDVNNIFSDISKSFNFHLIKKNIKLKVHDLPPCIGDITKLDQVFSNLVDNAIKYASPNRPGLIEVSAKKGAHFVTYSIKDNGIGIAKTCQNKVFNIFYRTDPTSPIEGEGLGLTIVKGIIDQHDGKIWVESESDQGTTFHITLEGSNNKPASAF